ncbi:caldesmon [Lepisosteus oculatus]|uniref:caldesmon n=1 Tax=Lepisosteus oculatus TaxID=7918 RepID=UPI00371D2E7C
MASYSARHGWWTADTAGPLRGSACFIRGDTTSNSRLLERIVNRGTLSTQRATHRHILELGDRRSASPAAPPPAGRVEDRGAAAPGEGDPRWQEGEAPEPRGTAEDERERALEQQRLTLQARFEEALRNRDRLEAEQRQRLRARLAARAQEQARALQARLEEERSRAVRQACEALAARLGREAEERGRAEAERVRAEAQAELSERVRQAEVRVREQCERDAARERRALREEHSQREAQLKEQIGELQVKVQRVTREKMLYEKEFKEVQVNYRRFVDLTDSSLHSDYLLRLRRLGREPGLAETGVQTDDVVGVAPPPELTPPPRGKSLRTDFDAINRLLPVAYF